MNTANKNKKDPRAGAGYIPACCAVLAFLCVFSFVLSYFSLLSGIRANKENMQRALDSFVTKTSKDLYAHVKRGNADLEDGSWDEDFWAYLAQSELAAVREGDRLTAYAEEGGTKWTLSLPKLSLADEAEEVLCLRADYVLTVPVPFGGITLGSMDIPLSVEAHFLAR